MLRLKEDQVLNCIMVHHLQYHTNQGSLIPIHKLMHRLESQGMVSKTYLPFNGPIWPLRKSNGECGGFVVAHHKELVIKLGH